MTLTEWRSPKRWLLPVALCAALAGAVQVIRQFVPPATPVVAAEIVKSLEAAFPQDAVIPVEIETPSNASELLTAREQRDQIRDWLLLTVLTNAGLAPEELNEITADLPPTRYGFMKGVADWEFGDVRSRAIGDGLVVALIPRAAGDRRTEYLCDIADQSRRAQGRRPARMFVIEYAIDEDLAAATLTRRRTVPGDDLFTAAAGYVERPVTSLKEFQRFHDDVDVCDSMSRCAPGSSISAAGASRDVRSATLPPPMSRCSGRPSTSCRPRPANTRSSSSRRRRNSRIVGRISTIEEGDYAALARLRRQMNADQAGVADEVAEVYRRKHQVADGLGFSLNPRVDYAPMAGYVEANLGNLPVQRKSGLDALDSSDYSQDAIRAALDRALGRTPSSQNGETLSASEVGEVAAALRAGRTRLFFEALQRLEAPLGENIPSESVNSSSVCRRLATTATLGTPSPDGALLHRPAGQALGPRLRGFRTARDGRRLRAAPEGRSLSRLSHRTGRTESHAPVVRPSKQGFFGLDHERGVLLARRHAATPRPRPASNRVRNPRQMPRPPRSSAGGTITTRKSRD